MILAGVHDIRSLKRRIRSDEDHRINSPWNIAAPFTVDMSLSEEGIVGMLAEYLDRHHLNIGYLLTFNFNKKKETGVKHVSYEDKTLIEAMV